MDEDDERDETEEELEERCKALMGQSDVVLFMKGDPEVPRLVPFFWLGFFWGGGVGGGGWGPALGGPKKRAS